MTEPEDETDILLRPAHNTDVSGIIDLVARCFADYPGCEMDEDGEERDLLTPETSFEHFWVAIRKGVVVGMIGCSAIREEAGERIIELKRLYLDHSLRGTGYSRILVSRVENQARQLGATMIDLWTDSRFETAHAVYARFGYVKQTKTRDLHDESNTTEYYFIKNDLSRKLLPL